MNGYQVFASLKEIDSNVAVLLSSGYSIDSQANDSMIRGCWGDLQKPYRVEELSSKLSEAMQSPSTASRRG